jgi:hypothetical protein
LISVAELDQLARQPVNEEEGTMERRDIGIGLGGLLTGLALVSGLLYYAGGWEAFSPVTNKGNQMAEKVGIRMPASTDAEPEPSLRVTEIPKSTASPGASANPSTGGTAILRVKLNNLTMHRCPGYECEKIATLPIGTKVVLLGERDLSPGEEWCRVRVGKSQGWVSRYYLE